MTHKKHAILEVVLKYLAHDEKNDALTISNIAKDTGIGKSTVYEYFKSKDDMITDALSMLMKKNLETIMDVEGFDTMDFESAFKSHLTKLFELAENKEMVHDYSHHPDIALLPKDKKEKLLYEMHEITKSFQKRLDAILTKGIEEDVLASPITAIRRQTIESMIFGSVVATVNPFATMDYQAMIGDLYEALLALHR